MKTPQVPAMPGMSELGLGLNKRALDNKHVAEYYWAARKLAPAPQEPCDSGLFSDDANQLDLMEKCK